MKKRILAIDDSKAIRFLLQTVLAKSYQIVTVPDGYSAMYYLANRELPDLIIVDPQLPDMREWELIQQLSCSGMYGGIPVVVLSAADAEETKIKCGEHGVVRYFMKPFNPLELMEAIPEIVKTNDIKKDSAAVIS